MHRRWISAAVVAAMLAIPGLAAAQPANDNFADAVAAPVPFVDNRNTEGATTEPDEPLPCGAMEATIWYRLEPTTDTTVSADTMGSDFDTVLAAYVGDDLGSLELLDCNDDNFDLTSFISFEVTAGEIYYIQAGGFGGSIGNLQLSVYAPGAIEGTVTDGSAEPLANICVDAYAEFSDWEGTYLDWIDGTLTDEDGTYRLGSVQGEILVRFRDCLDQVYVTEWFDDAASSDDATPLLVPAGETFGGIDAVLAVGGSISGRVTDVDGNPLDDICVEAVSADETLSENSWTRADGTYRIGGIRTGDYAVSFNQCGPVFTPRPIPDEEVPTSSVSYVGNDYATEWYDGKSSFETADLISAILGEATTGIDADLPLRPRPDVTVSDLKVENVKLQTDAGELPTGTGWTRKISFTVDNVGEVRANRARIIVAACSRTDGRCRVLLDVRRGLDPGASFSRTLDWNALGQLGDVRIIANISHFDDPNRTNNRLTQDHYAVVGGTGFGYTLCPGVPFLRPC